MPLSSLEYGLYLEESDTAFLIVRYDSALGDSMSLIRRSCIEVAHEESARTLRLALELILLGPFSQVNKNRLTSRNRQEARTRQTCAPLSTRRPNETGPARSA